MRSGWRALTGRGRLLLLVGLAVVMVAMAAGQRDVMRLGIFLAALPAVAAVVVVGARLRMSCERAVDPAQVPLGSPMHGRITLGQQARLPAAVVLLEDEVPPELGTRPRLSVDRADSHWSREVEYPLLGRVRGRFATGPLLVRTADPFGLVRLDRQFAATSEVMVTPQVVPLPVMRSAGGAGSAGEARPHRIGVVGSDDVLIREYRQGDDMRRIHWRSTARRGEMMVRREEQAWDPSASVLLDSRASAHAGPGLFNSLEWAVSAAASIAVHFLADGYGVEVYEADGPLHIGQAGPHSSTSAELVVNRLTDLRPREATSLHYAVESAMVDQPSQLVVAILGRLDADDANALLRVRRNRAQGLVLLLDVDTFAEEPARARHRAQFEAAAALLRENSWRVVEVTRAMTVDQAWRALETVGSAA